MSLRLLPGVVVAVALGFGLVAPATAETLVMVSPPPQLDAAVRTSLKPWRVKIVVIEMASGTPAELALTLGAGFVVWRDQDELVLWNASGAVGERRDIPPGLDDAEAAALALSIKTWMNLGAPPAEATDALAEVVEAPPADEVPPVGPVLPPPPRVRVDASAGLRANLGDLGRTEMRAAFSAAVRAGPVEGVLAVELGQAYPASAENGTGELSVWVLSAGARWPVPLSPSLTVAPGAGLVLEFGSLSGVDTMNRSFASSSTGVGIEATGLVEWRYGRLVAGLELGATGLPGTTTYKDRNVRMETRSHLETRGLARLGLILR